MIWLTIKQMLASCLPHCPDASLDSTPAFLLLSLPPDTQAVLASELLVDTTGLLLPGAFERCLCYTFPWDLIFSCSCG